MALVIETPVGPINDFNTVFFTSTDYQAGSTKVWRNGLLELASLQDGWLEAGGRKLLLKEAPRTGDILRVYYLSL